MPELVLQVMVLAAPGEWWYLQAISLATTVASAVLLLVLTEVSMTSTDESHRLYGGTWGWQRPMSTRKWGVTLFTLALFLGGNLLLAVTSAAIVSRSYPVSLACVLLTDCGLYLLTKAVLDQEFDQVSYMSDVPSNTLRLLTVDPLLNALTWAFIHFCPLPVLRHPMWVAPHNYARIVLCNLGEGAVFIALALNSGEANVVHLARYVCMPSLCVALITLVTFMLLIERRFWWTFCWRWSRRADVRARWIDLLHDPTDEDQSHRKMIEDPKHKLKVALLCEDLAVAWISSWKARPSWCTAEWLAALPPSLAASLPAELATYDDSEVSSSGKLDPAAYVQQLAYEILELEERSSRLDHKVRRLQGLRMVVSGGLLFVSALLFFPFAILGWIHFLQWLPYNGINGDIFSGGGSAGLCWIPAIAGYYVAMLAILPTDTLVVRSVAVIFTILYGVYATRA
jgi:hypothetical protein